MMLLFRWVVTDGMDSALALIHLAQVLSLCQVLAVVLVPLVVDLAADLLLVVDLLVDHVLPLATSAVDQTTLLVIAKLRP
jgi:hypothetical protein